MKKYKVFYKDTEVAEFNIFYNAIVYIHSQLDVDKDLNREDFYVYEITNATNEKTETIYE